MCGQMTGFQMRANRAIFTTMKPANFSLGTLLLSSLLLFGTVAALSAAEKPNIIFLLSDDVAQGDLGCYGQKLIQTPNVDRMAREGMRTTQAYCGTTVCAPSRTALMTGVHMGHSPIRANREIGEEGQ